MSHHFKREQRRALVIAVVLFCLLLAIFIPLLLRPGLRLDVAETLGMVPDAPRERLFPGAAGLELVVLVEEVPVQSTLPTRRYTAAYVAQQMETHLLLHDLGAGRTLTLPLADYDLIAAAADRSAILVVDRGVQPPQAVLVTVATGRIHALPPGQTDPGIPGNWDQDVVTGAAGCSGVSPRGDWVACASGSPRVLGDWELQIHPIGRVRDKEAILRGRGTTPILGWAADQSAIYLQNENGILKVPVNL